MSREYTDRIIVLDRAAANGASPKGQLNFEAFRNIEVEVVMEAFSGTVKFAGSNADVAPDFGSAATYANPWDFVKAINLIDGSSVAGGTGLSGTATTSVTNLEINTNCIGWLGVIVSSVSGGTVTVRAKGAGNT